MVFSVAYNLGVAYPLSEANDRKGYREVICNDAPTTTSVIGTDTDTFPYYISVRVIGESSLFFLLLMVYHLCCHRTTHLCIRAIYTILYSLVAI